MSSFHSICYASAFFGKWHLGDIEESYCTKQGFDERVWTPYNQFPIIYGPLAEIAGGVSPTSAVPDVYPNDRYDIDKDWRTMGHSVVPEGKRGGPGRETGQPGDLPGWYKNMEGNKEGTLSFIDENVDANKPFFID